MLSKYCYGPVMVIDVKKFENSMQLTVQEEFGKTCTVYYNNCIYWQIDETLKGERLLMVEEKTVQELLNIKDSPCVCALNKNAASIDKLLIQWHEEGMHFYLHYADNLKEDYLVVASGFEYQNNT